ncbi:MATE family efflux transporter [Bacillus sp. CMF21]|uniref:MATE family efflux transporter n=1 Tax=Metabacillus dongyingensis TaxID=2874282 RepID=UPI001CBB7255|nr:MATE family efflux transporter [Metabacillus dongyingensis]UOK58801.1 MATE family efflux transporter [Bacillus sp. OVS6]USK29583.1 MATE family efflux transporter [Bacillus sp. CMF21]
MPQKIKDRKLTLFALTWPIFIELFLHMLMGSADTIMLSQYSDHSVAAVGVANQILNVLIVMFGFIATGTIVLITQNIGANNNKSALEISQISIAANLILGIAVGLIVIIFSESMLKMMNLPADLLPEANYYLRLVGGLCFIQALIMTIGAVLKSYGFTKDTMYITIGMNILHIFGNYIFIYGPFGLPVLGVEGVAFSTVASRFIGLIVISYLLVKRISFEQKFRQVFKLPVSHLKNLLKIGVPSAGEHLSYNGSQIVITIFITMIGAEALTTKVYAQNLMMFIFLFSLAISQGNQILIGQMAGAREYDRAYKRCINTLYWAIGMSTAIAVVFSISTDFLFGIFTSNPEILQIGATILLLTVILEPGRAFNLVIISALRATGDVKFPVYMGILSMWGISVPLAYLLGIHFELGLAGIWVAFIADEWLRGILMLIRWRSKVWVNKGFILQSQKAVS